MEKELEHKLSAAGYRMLGDDRSMNGLIIDILKTADIRYLKAIPFLIYKYGLNLQDIYEKTEDKGLFSEILRITAEIFQEFGIGKDIPLYDKYQNQLDYDEFRDEFELQLMNEKRSGFLIDKQKMTAERDLHYWMSQLFTKKEKYIINRLLKDEPVSKTDYEYFSRKTKKKFKSIIYLNDLAKTLINRSPKYDEELFELKNLLEQEIAGTEAKLLEFFIWKDGRLFLRFTSKEDGSDQDKHTTIRIDKIKDKRINQLLEIYPKHDFR